MWFARSMKNTPGSPSSRRRERSLEDVAGVELADDLAGAGVDQVVGLPASSASMKASVTATEMLKFVI